MKTVSRTILVVTLLATGNLLLSDRPCPEKGCKNGTCKQPTCTPDLGKEGTLIRLKNEQKNAFIKVAYNSKNIEYSCKYTNCQGCATRFTIEKNGDLVFLVYKKHYLHPDLSLKKEKPQVGWSVSKNNQNPSYHAGDTTITGYN